MSKINIFFIAIYSLISCNNSSKKSEVLAKENHKIEGVYKTIIDSNETKDCEIFLEILRNKSKFTYHLKTDKKDIKGRIVFDDNDEYILLYGIKWDEFDGDSTDKNDRIPDYVQAFIGIDSLSIENYGNSMNNYTVFGECGRKFIILTKQ